MSEGATLAYAVICEAVEESADSPVITLRRVHTVLQLLRPITRGESATLQSVTDAPLVLAIGLYASSGHGRHTVTVRPQGPSGLYSNEDSAELDYGAPLIRFGINLTLVIGEEGEYKFHVLLDGEPLTTVPLIIRH